MAVVLTPLPFGASAGDAVALLNPDGTEMDFAGYSRIAAGRWLMHADGTLENQQHLSFPECKKDERSHWVGGIALMRGSMRYRSIHLNSKMGVIEGLNFWFAPGQLVMRRAQ